MWLFYQTTNKKQSVKTKLEMEYLYYLSINFTISYASILACVTLFLLDANPEWIIFLEY